MSPIPDPRFSKARWDKTLEQDREAGDRASRMEYIKPLVMLIVGGAVMMGVWAFADRGMADAPTGPLVALLYPVWLLVELVFGVVGLWITTKLWLGGVGPLGLAILRLAGIYAATDLIQLVVAPLMIVGWIIHLVSYVLLLAWLFDLEIAESVILAVITFLLKVAGGAVILFML